MNQYDLAGRHAVVTGGASGIGFAIGQRLAACGAKVVIWDMEEKAGGAAATELAGSSVVTDVTDWDSLTNAVRGHSRPFPRSTSSSTMPASRART
jgi:3-oxoacyl-[acyl-carrier protein] reductase